MTERGDGWELSSRTFDASSAEPHAVYSINGALFPNSQALSAVSF